MIDAGSTGSRIHIYKFHNCYEQPAYESEVFEKKQPGLSSFPNPSAAAESLDELMDLALKTVPPSLHSCTPVAVKATAGLRLKGPEASDAILKAIRTRLHTKYPFPFGPKDAVAIMDGKDEGVYAWLTVNYLLDVLSAHPSASAQTYAVLDLGGGSTQIVFKPEHSNGDKALLEGEHKYVLSFAGRNHTLYQHSYLGYGLMSARKSTHKLAAFMASFNQPSHHASPTKIANPCISKGESRHVELEDGRKVTMEGVDVGSFTGCRRLMELVLAKDACAFRLIFD
jgi:guanosine-diphosphatase